MLKAIAFHGTKKLFLEAGKDAQIDLQLPASKDLPNGGVKTVHLYELPPNCALRVTNSVRAKVKDNAGFKVIDNHSTWRAFVRKVNSELSVE